MKLHAILWDGFSKIQGELELENERLTFHLHDFAKTDLVFDLEYDEIKAVNLHSVFDLQQVGLEVVSRKDKVNIFIAEEPRRIRELLFEKIQLRRS